MNDHAHAVGPDLERAMAFCLRVIADLFRIWTLSLAVILSTVRVVASVIEPSDLVPAALPSQPSRPLPLRRGRPGTCKPRPRPAPGMG